MAYSNSRRFRRWKVRRPGFGLRCAAASSVLLDELEQCVPLGRPRTRRRHHARAELTDHALDHFRVLRGGRDVELLQGQIAAEARVRVASHAGVSHDFVGIDFRRERSLVQTGNDRHVVGRQVDRLACEHQCQAQHAGADDD